MNLWEKPENRLYSVPCSFVESWNAGRGRARATTGARCCGMALLCPWWGRETAKAARWPRADEYEADREGSLTLRQDP